MTPSEQNMDDVLANLTDSLNSGNSSLDILLESGDFNSLSNMVNLFSSVMNEQSKKDSNQMKAANGTNSTTNQNSTEARGAFVNATVKRMEVLIFILNTII